MPIQHPKSVIALLGLALVSATLSGAASSITPPHLVTTNLRCEYMTDPLGVGETSPRLTWIVESDRRAESQTAYRILVASTPDLLAKDHGDLWDSGKVISGEAAHIPYGGTPLQSRQPCHWKVMSWDRDGNPGGWSAPAVWEMGLIAPSDWHAQWIEAGARPVHIDILSAAYFAVNGSATRDVTRAVAAMVERGEPVLATNAALGGDPAVNVPKRLAIDYQCDGAVLHCETAENSTALIANQRLPYLRRSFRIDKPVAKARLFATALGLYDAYLNGSRIGDQHLAPGWTDYRKRVRYQAIDVTGQLKQGENTIGAMVGPGWFSGRAGLFHAREFYGKTPALLAQLEVTFTDGSTQLIVSDATWLRHDGPICTADIMDGDLYDARAELPDWCSPGDDDHRWESVHVRAEYRNLDASVDAPVRVLRELPAVSLKQPVAGKWTFDLGQNMVGVVRLTMRCEPGTVVTIRHGELLNPDGTIYTANLRGAAATDTYICKGGDSETWQPDFTFHGFRYVEVVGPTEAPYPADLTGIVLGSDLPPAGEFTCSDNRINQLQSNITWGLRGNYLSIPTDCPQRDERMGWMADAQVFAPTAAYNADVAAFMTKWMVDVDDAQREDGAHSDVAPVMKGLTFGTPAWADAGTIVPWTVYQMTGDTRILERHIDAMTRWVDWCKANSTGLIRDHARGNDYGDWLSIGADTPKDLIGTAYFAHSTDILVQSLRALGRSTDADGYQKLLDDIRAAFAAKYVSPDGRVTGDTQCGYVLALRFNLLPDHLRPEAVRRLVADIQAKGDHLSTGFVGVANLLPVLSDAGRSDVAYSLLLQDTFPSWLYSVRQGATTIWERWDGATIERGPHPDIGMNSFNHYSLGSCGQWLFEGVGGIQPDPEHPGFDHFFIRPHINGPLSSAAARYRSIHGEIRSEWHVQGDQFTLNLTIPANTTATVSIPCAPGEEVLESGRDLRLSEGVSLVRRGSDVVALSVGSGLYTFTSHRPAKLSGNPILPGWYADPEVVALNGQFWIYPTTAAPYDQQTRFDAFSSPDLVRWTRHASVLESGAVSWAKRAMWAPSVIEQNHRYYFFFGANDIQNDSEHGGIGVAVADDPAGPFKDYLGKPLVDAFHNGAQPIDQFAFRDPDGHVYLIYGGWRHCNIGRLRDDFKGFDAFADGTTFKEITPEGYVEGPFMFVRSNKYYFMWSEGGWTGPDYCVAYAMADSPLGPFKRIGKVLQQDPAIATGAGHHSVLRVPDTDDYYMVYHRRPLGETDANHRVVCIERMTFDAEGRINPVRLTLEGVPERR